jgi:hypothetical protein
MKDGKLPRFTYGEKVRITAGFYRGRFGVVEHCFTHTQGFWDKKEIRRYILEITGVKYPSYVGEEEIEEVK